MQLLSTAAALIISGLAGWWAVGTVMPYAATIAALERAAPTDHCPPSVPNPPRADARQVLDNVDCTTSTGGTSVLGKTQAHPTAERLTN